MGAFLIADLVIGAVGLLVVAFVAFPYRGRTVPKARRLSSAVADVTEKLDPGPAPAHGVLGTPEKSRRISRRIEKIESLLRHPARAMSTAGREQS
jgi:hypothetical protein